MARPLNKVRRALTSCLPRLGERSPSGYPSAPGNGSSEQLRRILAVLNMTTVVGIIGYSIGSTFTGLRLEAPLLEQVSGHLPTSVLVMSSLLASVLLLLSSYSVRDLPGANSSDSSHRQDLQIVRTDIDRACHEETPNTILSTMNHDLRTPLNAIIGFSDMMHQEMHGPLGSERYQSYAMHIRDSGLALLDSIETTLALTERLSERHPGILARELSALEQSGTN